MASKFLVPLLFSTLFALQLLHFSSAQTTNVVKAAYWYYDAGFAASDINSTLFTHLYCSFANVSDQTYQVIIPPSAVSQFSTFTQTVQKKNPSVKTFFSIGGGEAPKQTLISMASQPSSRKSFIDSSITLARSNNFHGLDLDWEYPSDATQMANFGLLITEWKAAVAAEARASGKTSLLLSAAVLYLSYYYSTSVPYPIQKVSNSLDWINLMAYDFYGPGWTPSYTGPPGALYNPGRQESGDNGVQSWIQAGLSPKKIVLGVPFFGRTWLLRDANQHGLFAPANGVAPIGDGLTYKKIKQYIANNRATKVYNATVVGDYCYSGTTWIGYDDTQSITTKVSYARNKLGLLGYFAWHVGCDDENWSLSTTALRTWEA